MSRIGKRPIEIQKNIKVTVQQQTVTIEGPKGKLSLNVHPRIKVDLKDNIITLSRGSDSKFDKSLHGLFRTLIFNMIKGITDGYLKELEINGVGFRAQIQDKNLVLNLGFSHPVIFPIPVGITIETPKPERIIVKGVDKVLVGQTAANIRDLYRPEPYKGKGIRYSGEYVRRKAGKTVA